MTSSDLSVRSRKRWNQASTWLWVSVVANLVLIGIMTAWTLNMQTAEQGGGWREQMIAAMSPADATVVRDAMKRRETLETQTSNLISAQYNKLRATVRQEPFDRGECEKVLSNMSEIRNDQQVSLGQIFVQEVNALTPQGRAELVAAMERQSRKYQAQR